MHDANLLLFLLLLAGPALPTPAAGTPPLTGEIRLSVTVTGPDKKTGPGVGTVVWIPETAAERREAETAGTKARIASHMKRFDPRVSVVPVGTTVEFPNLDKIFHNVFSLSERAKFDLGLYRNGASRSMTFDNPGTVKIYCNIHPQMAAYLIVVDGRIYAQTGADGTAVLAGVPPGRHTVRAWDEKGGDWTGEADVSPGRPATLSIALDGSSFREAAHKNKYGKAYPPPNDDENRY